MRKIIIIGLLAGLGYGAYRVYRRGANKVIDLGRLQVTIGSIGRPRIERGFIFLPLELSINNPTNSNIDTNETPLSAFAEISLNTKTGLQPLFSGLVDLAKTKLNKQATARVPVTLQTSLLQLGASLLQIGGLSELNLKITPRLGVQELPIIEQKIPLN